MVASETVDTCCRGRRVAERERESNEEGRGRAQVGGKRSARARREKSQQREVPTQPWHLMSLQVLMSHQVPQHITQA